MEQQADALAAGLRRLGDIHGSKCLGVLVVYPKSPSTQVSYTLKNSYLHNYYPKPEYLIIGSCGPLGLVC